MWEYNLCQQNTANKDVESLMSVSLVVPFVASACFDMYRCATEGLLFLMSTACLIYIV